MALQTMIEKWRAGQTALCEATARDIAQVLGALLPEDTILEWTQYTSLWNDDETRAFGVRTPFIATRCTMGQPYERRLGINLGDQDSLQINYRFKDNVVPGLTEESMVMIRRAFGSIPPDAMQTAFGDHVLVRVRSDGTYKTFDFTDHE